jgi:hypothetical protein
LRKPFVEEDFGGEELEFKTKLFVVTGRGVVC